MTGDPVFWLWLLLALAGIVVSALCSGLETGVYTINSVRLTVRSGRGEKRAKVLESELGRPGRMLTTLLLGTNIGNYFGSLGIAGALDMLSLGTVLAIAINSFILVPVIFIFAETLPKDLFRTHTDRWTYAFATSMRATRLFLTVIGIVPLVAGIAHLLQSVLGGPRDDDGNARQRMVDLLREGVGAGLISSGQGDLASRAMLLRTCTVQTEMVPWRRVGTLPLAADQAAREAIMRSRSISRWPVVERTGRVAGILHALDAAVRPDQPTRKLLRPAITLDPRTPALEALRSMREARAQLAIVQRPGSSRPLGVVGLKDLVEPLTGELSVW